MRIPRLLSAAPWLVAFAVPSSGMEPWPQANGPTGNFSPLPSDVAVIDDASKARQLWLSEDKDLGYAKGSVSGYLSHLARWDGHPGSSSGPIIAEGKLFISTFRPTGDLWAENQHGLDKILDPNAKKPLGEEEKARLFANLRILADDLLVAIDVETGETVWKAAEAGGLNRYMGKRQGYCVSPAYHDGVVFSLGTTGVLRAYSSEDGTKLWETNIGPAHESALEHKASVLEKKMLPGGMGWDSSLVVAEGVLVVPLFDGADLGLRGVDVKDGETLWELENACSRHATPAVWSNGGRRYILAATVSGKMHLIDPANGEVKWSVDGLGENHFSLSPSNNLVLVNGGTSTPRKEGDTRMHGALAAYELSPEKATLEWRHPEERSDLFLPTWMDSCARRFIAVTDNRIFYYARAVEKGEQRLTILDPADGKVLDEFAFVTPAPQFYPLGDKLLMIRDASHSDTELAMFSVAGDKIEQLADFWLPPHQNTTAYEVFMEHPLYQGRLYLRTRDGRIACYDLRKN